MTTSGATPARWPTWPPWWALACSARHGTGPPRCGGPVCVPSSGSRPELEAAASDLTEHDPHVDLAFAAGPRPDHGVLLQAAQLRRVRDAVRRAAHQHAPAPAEG